MVGVTFKQSIPKEGDECAVCTAEATGNERSRWKGHGAHHFHENCIDPWLNQQGVNATCPTCRLPAVSLKRRVWSMLESDVKRVSLGALLGAVTLLPIPHTYEGFRLLGVSAAVAIAGLWRQQNTSLELGAVSFAWAVLRGANTCTALSMGLIATQTLQQLKKNQFSSFFPFKFWLDIFAFCKRGDSLNSFGVPAVALPVVSYCLINAFDQSHLLIQIFNRAKEAIFS